MARQRHDETGTWISLMDFAIKKGVSLSTLRRHIKANKLNYQMDEGRYLLWDDGSQKMEEQTGSNELKTKLNSLTKDFQRAQEEIAELKTLIALYEENAPSQAPNKSNI